MTLLRNIRFYVLLFSILLSVGWYIWVRQTVPDGTLQLIRLTEHYGLTALVYLYFALLAGPFCYQMRWFPFRPQYMRARRAIGVSAWYFGVLHAYLAFFKQLGGFAGLPYLNKNYLIAISLSFTALLVLTAMAATSIDKVIAWMGFAKWKFLHRFIYLAGIVILVHALMLGSDFQNLSGLVPRIAFVFLAFLFFLEVRRVDAYLERKWAIPPGFGFTALGLMVVIGAGIMLVFTPLSQTGSLSLGIHSQHIQIAKDVQNAANINDSTGSQSATIPGLQGDRTRRFSVNFTHSGNPVPNKDVNLAFEVTDASNGGTILLFQKIYEKQMHLIIVDNNLNYFTHIHPKQDRDMFSIATQFPHEGTYHLYIDFQPFGAIEQQFAFTLKVGAGERENSTFEQDTQLTKEFGEYYVTLDYPKPLLASKLSIGEQLLTFTITDLNGDPVTKLKPYLAAFGHLVMIKADTFDYLHIHPNRLTPPQQDENGGPDVQFMPLGLYGPIKPGKYRIFGQFNPDNKLFTADFTVTVE